MYNGHKFQLFKSTLLLKTVVKSYGSQLYRRVRIRCHSIEHSLSFSFPFFAFIIHTELNSAILQIASRTKCFLRNSIRRFCFYCCYRVKEHNIFIYRKKNYLFFIDLFSLHAVKLLLQMPNKINIVQY